MKRILVTGSKGQMGMTLQELAPDYPDLDFHFTDKDILDITDADTVTRVFSELKPHYCINCAAYTQVDQAEKNPELAFEVNAKAVAHLADACSENDTILIHLSTDYVFDGTSKSGYRPGDEPNPINVYGKTKLEGERTIQAQLNNYFIVRTSWLYSKQYGHNFYRTILEKAKKGEKLVVTEQQTGCPTNALNLSKYLLDLIESDSEAFGIKHFTDGESMTWYEFAKNILADNGYNQKVNLQRGENYRTFAQRPINSILITE